MSSLFDDLILPGFGPGGPRAGALGDDSERAPGAVGSRRDDEVGPDGIPGWAVAGHEPAARHGADPDPRGTPRNARAIHLPRFLTNFLVAKRSGRQVVSTLIAATKKGRNTVAALKVSQGIPRLTHWSLRHGVYFEPANLAP